MNMHDDVVITLDVDWAPDFIIDSVADLLIENKVKATWFVTHDSDAINRLRSRSDLFELGIHPNFMEGSTQGNTAKEILSNLMKIVPEAVSLRTHGVVQSGALLAQIVQETPIKFDATLFLPEMEHISGVDHLTPYGALKRFATFWADDYQLLKGADSWKALNQFNSPGLKILNFHPIHIYLNTKSYDDYVNFRGLGFNMSDTTKKQLDSYVNTSKGVKCFFIKTIATLSNGGAMINEIDRRALA